MRAIKYLLLLMVIAVSSFVLNAGDIKSSGAKGLWSSPSTWIGGVVPSATDNAIVSNGDTVYYNVTGGTINNITIGENATVRTALLFYNDADYTLTVNGNISVSGDSAYFLAQANSAAVRTYTLTLKGNLISGGTLDFKTGSSPNNAFLNVVLTGTTNSILKCKPFVISPATVNEWAGIEFNKTGGAKVVLQSDIGVTNTSAAIVKFTSGIVQTGQYSLNVYGTGSGSITGGSQTSYVWGRLGRGWASSAGANNKIFPIGDSLKYRPLWLSDVTSPYHLSIVELVSGNANTGTSVLNGGIDKVSAGRYYKVWSGLIPRSGTVYQQFGLAGAGIGYYADDGVAAGNSNLRIAVSAVNGRGTWTGYGPTTHTTTFSDPTQMVSDVITPTVMMDTGSVFYVALARVTGTTENSLNPQTDVREIDQIATEFSLSQNYPNPFNPSTVIRFSLPENDLVTLKVYDIAGSEIAALLNETKKAGAYEVSFDASRLTSGMYFYTLQTSRGSITKKMSLVK